MQTEEQKKQGGKLSAEETSRRKAAADAEVQRNLELEREWVRPPLDPYLSCRIVAVGKKCAL